MIRAMFTRKVSDQPSESILAGLGTQNAGAVNISVDDSDLQSHLSAGTIGKSTEGMYDWALVVLPGLSVSRTRSLFELRQ